jgi:hypothetical protein
VVSALEWAEIRTLAKDGVSQREIARRWESIVGRLRTGRGRVQRSRAPVAVLALAGSAPKRGR